VSGTEPDPTEPGHFEPEAAQPEAAQPQAAQPQAGQAEPIQAEPAQAEPAQSSPGYAVAPEGELLPGLSGPKPALEYLVHEQRRRSRRFAGVAGAAIAIVIIAALIWVVVPSGGHGRSSAQLTAAQVVAKAAQREAGLQSYTATMTENISGATTGTVSGTMKVQRSPLEMAMNLTVSVSGQSVPVSAIVSASTMYVKLPSLAGLPGLPAGMATKWLKLPLIGPGGTSPLASIEQELQRENPLTETAMFSAAEHLQKAGSQVINGVSTTKYTGWSTPRGVVKSLPAGLRSQLAPYVRLITGKVSLAIWIDAHGMVRKVAVTEHVGTDTVTTAFTYAAFNQPVSISIPPASQVYSVPQSDMTD
jgi:hypothetical protein